MTGYLDGFEFSVPQFKDLILDQRQKMSAQICWQHDKISGMQIDKGELTGGTGMIAMGMTEHDGQRFFSQFADISCQFSTGITGVKQQRLIFSFNQKHTHMTLCDTPDSLRQPFTRIDRIAHCLSGSFLTSYNPLCGQMYRVNHHRINNGQVPRAEYGNPLRQQSLAHSIYR